MDDNEESKGRGGDSTGKWYINGSLMASNVITTARLNEDNQTERSFNPEPICQLVTFHSCNTMKEGDDYDSADDLDDMDEQGFYGEIASECLPLLPTR